MNEFNTYEFVVAQKHEGKVQLFRILAVVSYVLFFCCRIDPASFSLDGGCPAYF